MQNKKQKEVKLSPEKFQFKEDEEHFYSEGPIATTHPDRDSHEDLGTVGDILTEEMIDRIVDTINDGSLPHTKMASYRHDYLREKDPSLPPAGVAVSAEKRQMDDGHFGAYVVTKHSKTYPEHDKLRYEVENEIIPGYSIEYGVNDYDIVNIDGQDFRLLTDIDYGGYGFANARLQANPRAKISIAGYKEMKKIIDSKKTGDTMKQKTEKKEVPTPQEKKEEGETVTPEPEEKKEEPAPASDEPSEEPEETEEEEEAKEMKVSKADYARLQKLKQKEREAVVEREFKERFNANLKDVAGENSPLINPESKKAEFKELKALQTAAVDQYKEVNENFKHSVDGQGQFAQGSFLRKEAVKKSQIAKMYKEGTRLGNKLAQNGVPVISNWQQHAMAGGDQVSHKERMQHVGVGGPAAISANPEAAEPLAGDFEVKESYWERFEMKAGAGLWSFSTSGNQNLADASWTYGSYYQSPVEFNDIYGPALINQLNDRTTTFGILRKENWAGRSQIQFRARTGRNSTAGGYNEGTAVALADFTSKVGKDKFQQPFSYYRVLVAVTGQMLQFAQAPGGIGDIWGTEIEWSGVDLVRNLNQAIIGTGDGTSESASLGFEGLILGTAGTLYGKNIATYTTLKSHKENMSSVRVKLDQLRKMIEYCTAGDSANSIESHANVGDLVFLCHPTQGRIIKGLIQDMQRTVPTSARVGFEGTTEFDGVPIFEDHLMNTDDIFLIDTAHTKLAINLGPVVEFLPVAFDGRAAQIKIYFNLYSDVPSNNYWAHTFATS